MKDSVVPIRRHKTSEWLEALARKPFARNREILLDLAEHFRAIEAIEDSEARQLTFQERAA